MWDEPDEPVQLELLELCDCCGQIFDGRAHKACDQAWKVWLRADNWDLWRDEPRRRDAL